MKYCPLCGSEFLPEVAVCANCSAPLVDSLDVPEVRNNPARLLWLGQSQLDFDIVIGALREAGIAVNGDEKAGGLIAALLKADSKIHVLQSDFARALPVAASALANRPRVWRATQRCHACGAECPTSLTACPQCQAVLYVEPQAESSAADLAASPDASPALKYCPLCDAEYAASSSRCTVCGVELVPEELRGRPLDDQQRNERLVVVWRGGDPLAVSEVINRLREAGIRHHVHATNDHLVFELGMPRPKYAVRVFASDVPEASELIADIRESVPFALRLEPISEEAPTPQDKRSFGNWNPAAATQEVWTGDDASLAQLLEACLRENRIAVRREGREPGRLRLLVKAGDEAAAREIVREVREATPPG